MQLRARDANGWRSVNSGPGLNSSGPPWGCSDRGLRPRGGTLVLVGWDLRTTSEQSILMKSDPSNIGSNKTDGNSMKRITVISQAAFSRLLKCSRSSVSAMVRQGLPVLEDGRIDRRTGLEWIAAGQTGSGGGWSADHGRVSIRERAESVLAGTNVVTMSARAPRPPETPVADACKPEPPALPDVVPPAQAKEQDLFATADPGDMDAVLQ